MHENDAGGGGAMFDFGRKRLEKVGKCQKRSEKVGKGRQSSEKVGKGRKVFQTNWTNKFIYT